MNRLPFLDRPVADPEFAALRLLGICFATVSFCIALGLAIGIWVVA